MKTAILSALLAKYFGINIEFNAVVSYAVDILESQIIFPIQLASILPMALLKPATCRDIIIYLERRFGRVLVVATGVFINLDLSL